MNVQPGRNIVWLPIQNGWTWQAIAKGEYDFTVKYFGDYSGTASCRVRVEGSEDSGDPYSTQTLVAWLPVSIDEAYIVAFYTWNNGSLIEGRDFILGFIEGCISVSDFKPGLWKDIKDNFTGLYDVTRFLEFEPKDNTSITYTTVRVSELQIEGLNDTAVFKPLFDSLPSQEIYVAETAIIVYSLNWTENSIWGRIKLMDWAIIVPINGLISIIIRTDYEVKEEWFMAEPYTDFKVSVPLKYQAWAVAIAPGINRIYLNERYGRLLLIRRSS